MFIVPCERLRRESYASNSRFIATLCPADSVEEARACIAEIRAEFPDAAHNVPAFVVGGANSTTEFCSDDGEPSGTSGRPLLAVLKGSGLGNAVVVVTRYFGGTLLGTGGLVRAYGDAGRAVCSSVRRAELVQAVRARFRLEYHLYERAKALAEACGGRVAAEDFAEAVTLEAELPVRSWEELSSRLADLGSGRIEQRVLGDTLMRVPL